MSAFINEEGEFTKFYGTVIMSKIINKDDFFPLLTILKTFPQIKVVKNINWKIIDVFSQTLSSMIGDNCPVIDEWYQKNGGGYKPYQFLPYDVILQHHYCAKDILRELFPVDFTISNNVFLKIKNNKILLTFEFQNEQENKTFKKIISSLNSLYKIRRGITKHIVLGYLKSAPFEFTAKQYNELNKLIPRKIYLEKSDVYQYNTVDSFYLYSSRMN